MTDDLDRRLAVLIAPPDPDEVDAALRTVLRRSRRQGRTRAAVGVAAASAVAAAGVTALLDRAPGADRGGDPADVATGPPADDWPWTTSTTGAPPPMSPAERAALVDEVLDVTDDPGTMELFRMCCGDADTPGGPVPLELRADAVELAAELRARWGDAVDIRLGCHRYPSGEPVDVPPGPHLVPGSGPSSGSGPGIEGLTATLTFGGGVASGADTTATLTLHNSTAAAVEVLPPNTAEVAAPGGDEVVGTTRMVFASVAQTVIVPAGGEIAVDVVVGTTACTPDGPPGLAPGPYEAVAEITTLTDGTPAPTLVTRAPLTVTPLPTD